MTLGDDRDLVGPRVGLALAQDQLGLCRSGADHVQYGHPQPAVVGAACGLAIDGDTSPGSRETGEDSGFSPKQGLELHNLCFLDSLL